MIYPVDMAVIMLQLFGVVIDIHFHIDSGHLYIPLSIASSVRRFERENQSSGALGAPDFLLFPKPLLPTSVLLFPRRSQQQEVSHHRRIDRGAHSLLLGGEDGARLGEPRLASIVPLSRFSVREGCVRRSPRVGSRVVLAVHRLAVHVRRSVSHSRRLDRSV